MSDTSIAHDVAVDAPAAPSARRGLLFPVALIWAGLLFIACAAIVEDYWLAGKTWSGCVLVTDMPLKDYPALAGMDGVFPVMARVLDEPPSGEGSPESGLRALERLIVAAEGEDASGVIHRTECAVMPFVPDDELASLLESGRVPEPGAPEALAGDLCEQQRFVLDGTAFEVVGRLRPEVAGFVHTYLVPYSPDFSGIFVRSSEATQGWLDSEGMQHLEEIRDAIEFAPRKTWHPENLAGEPGRTRLFFVWMVFAGLVLAALGGALFHMRLFAAWSTPPTPILGPLLGETVAWPRLFGAMHLVLYGSFFAAMAAAVYFPDFNYALLHFVSKTFSDGNLSYIGDAYKSGDILDAALTTFHNNYWVQTVQYTFALSFALLPLGFLKTILSFVMAGFVMSPLWIGTASAYVFHSITMILELEAYIVASFAVVVWPARFVLAIRDAFRCSSNGNGGANAQPYRHLVTGIRGFIGGLLLTGAMLAVAALYEAISLILLAG